MPRPVGWELDSSNGAFEKVASTKEGILENTRVVKHLRMAKKQIHAMKTFDRYAIMLSNIILLGWINIGNEVFQKAHERRRAWVIVIKRVQQAIVPTFYLHCMRALYSFVFCHTSGLHTPWPVTWLDPGESETYPDFE